MPYEVAESVDRQTAQQSATWAHHAHKLWRRRSLLLRALMISTVAGVAISLALPKRYTSIARIMPPEQQGSSSLMLAALASKAGAGSLGSLAPIFFTGHSTTALFVDLLRSGTVSGHLIERYQLQKVYRKKYRTDTAKRLVHNTTISDDKRSGVITIQVEDANPVRARDLTQGYLDELNNLVVQTNTSAAHRERTFVEQRLRSVEDTLERAQTDLSEFSSRNGAVDLKEQTRAVVDAGARLETELLVQESSLSSLRQVWGDGNIRVRETQARIVALRSDLSRLSGTTQTTGAGTDPVLELAPALRDVPRLSVPYADLYRRVKVQESVLELLTQQYETARIEEAKDVPIVSVIDSPGVPEKKSFPPRTLVTAAIVSLGVGGTSAWILLRARWQMLAADDPLKLLFQEIGIVARQQGARGAK